MITATLRKDGFRIEGHANYAPSGQDVVCASVSILVFSFLTACDVNHIEYTENEIDTKKGVIDVCDLDYKWRSVSSYLCDVLVSGLCLIENMYPDYIRVVDA